MKKSPTFSYNLPYENNEKKSSYEVEYVRVCRKMVSCNSFEYLFDSHQKFGEEQQYYSPSNEFIIICTNVSC